MSRAGKYIKTYLFLFAFLSILLILAHMIPEKNIRKNIEGSIQKLEEEGLYREIGYPSVYSKLDGWTEATILNFSYCAESAHPVKGAFFNERYSAQLEPYTGLSGLVELVVNNEGQYAGKTAQRSTYWIGYRIFLRPLLYFTHYFNIRSIFMIFTVFFWVISIIVITKKTNGMYAGLYAFSYLMVNNIVVLYSMSLGAFCFQITSLSIIVYLYMNHKKLDYMYFMFVVGILTAFIDWFSLPLSTFGMITVLMLYREYSSQNDIGAKSCFSLVFKNAIGWGLGYALMIIGRVVFCAMIGGKNSWGYFVSRFTTNVNAKEDNSFIDGVSASVKNCLKGLFPFNLTLNAGGWYEIARIMVIMALIIGIVTIFLRAKNKAIIVSLVTVAVSPLAWFVVFNGYCQVHYWIAHRILIISIFALLTILYISFAERIRCFVDTCKMRIKSIEK